jgi:methyl-accepting chemotaxis protein
VFFVVLIIAIGFAIFVSRSILSGINQLNETMKRVSETQDLSLSVSTNSDDEVGEMANSFNDMLGKFRNLITAVNLSVDTVHEATDSLSKNIHLANSGVDSQIQQTDMVATAVTEMVATVDEIANNTNAAASKAEATNNNAISGKEGVTQTIAKIDELSEKLRESENIVHQLAKDSDTIGSVLDVIRGIAEQTNLLALNAAIEAARAGEQGRGFAVVADEVRTLASRTQDSTQEIETIISSLQGRTKEIVSHMAICRTQGKDSADQASSAGKMLEEITQDVSTIMEMNTAIASAIQEQSTVASEVNKHVVEIRDVAEQAGQISNQNAQMSEELSQQAAVLNKEVSQFKV